MIVHVAQPLVFVVGIALRLVAEQDDGAAAGLGASLLHLVDQPQALGRIRSRIRIRITDRLQQIREERPFRVPRLMFGLYMVARDLRIILRKQ